MTKIFFIISGCGDRLAGGLLRLGTGVFVPEAAGFFAVKFPYFFPKQVSSDVMWAMYGLLKNLPDKSSTVDTFFDYSVAFYHQASVRVSRFPFKTRTDSVQKVCGGVGKGFDHLTNLESSKVEVVLQFGLRSSSTL